MKKCKWDTQFKRITSSNHFWHYLKNKRKNTLCAGYMCPSICDQVSVPIPFDRLPSNSV
jgi:hypothetical protein